MNNRLLIAVAAVALVVCATAAWFLQKDAPPMPVISVAPAPVPLPPLDIPPEPIPTNPAPAAAATERTPEKNTPAPRGIEEWEKKIDQALGPNVNEAQAAQILINMLPTLPPEGQVDAAQHISNLVLDQDYSRVLPLLRNPNLPEDVLDVFVTDLMNREDPVKLPALLEVAKIPNHPHHEEAKADLEIFLDQDHGNDWGKWDGAVKKYLQEQAAESAAETVPGKPVLPAGPARR